MLYSAIGISDDIDVDAALTSAIDSCKRQLTDKAPQVGIFFTSLMDADHSALLRRILANFPGLQLIGCTTDGELCRPNGFQEDAVALLLLASDTITFATSVARKISDNPSAAFTGAVTEARRKLVAEPALAITLPDGLSTLGCALDRAIRHSFGEYFPVFGGTAGDHFLLTGTRQFFQEEVLQDAAPLLFFGGEVNFRFAVEKGPVPTGPYYSVGRVENNTLYEIDGVGGVDFYQRFFGQNVQELTQFPLAIYEQDEDDFYLRDPLYFNQEDRSVNFVGNFPGPCRARVTLVSRDDVLDSARRGNSAILGDGYFSPELVFIFSCTSQRHVLGSKTNEKFTLLNQSCHCPYFGFYCYGELAPPGVGKATQFHNDTYVILALSSHR